MYARDEIGDGQWLETTSPRNTSFRGDVLGPAHVGRLPALDTAITGQSRILAHSQIVVDLDDPLLADLELTAVLGGR